MVLTDDGSEGLPGWRWKFPSQGRFCEFPEKNTFWQWSTDQLNSGLDALAKKALVLEPLDGTRTESNRSSPEVSIGGSNPSVVLGSPEPSPEEDAWLGIQDSLKSNVEDPGLDDIVMQLRERSRQWKELTRDLKQSKQREEDLRATIAEKTTRIDELEKTVSDHAKAASENHQDSNLKSGMEYILGELGRIKAINEELKNTIKKHEDEARDSMYIKFMFPVVNVSRLVGHSLLFSECLGSYGTLNLLPKYC